MKRLADSQPQLFSARVMHKRLQPKENQFSYGVYYLALPVKQLTESLAVPVNKRGLISFWEKDHGARNGASLELWIWDRLTEYGIQDQIDEVILVAMPRMLGYAFNPVSFWLCLNKDGELQVVLCEVNNTFGETHSYLCAQEDGSPINEEDWLSAEKCFHVSPFLDRTGSYQFRFKMRDQQLSIWIHYFDENQKRTLITSLIGSLQPLTRRALVIATLRSPMVTMKTILLIHWQAMKLLLKGCRFFTKPPQLSTRVSSTGLRK